MELGSVCANVSTGEEKDIDSREEEVRGIPGEAVTRGETSARDTGGGGTETGEAAIVVDGTGKRFWEDEDWVSSVMP